MNISARVRVVNNYVDSGHGVSVVNNYADAQFSKVSNYIVCYFFL